MLRTVALQGHNGERGRSRLQIPFLPRSHGFIFLVRVHHTTGNYASFLPRFPGFDFSSSCVAQLVQVKLFYSIKSMPLQVIKIITLSSVKGISVIPILQVWKSRQFGHGVERKLC